MFLLAFLVCDDGREMYLHDVCSGRTGDGTKAMAERNSLPVTAHNVIGWKRCRGWGLSAKYDTGKWQELRMISLDRESQRWNLPGKNWT